MIVNFSTPHTRAWTAFVPEKIDLTARAKAAHEERKNRVSAALLSQHAGAPPKTNCEPQHRRSPIAASRKGLKELGPLDAFKIDSGLDSSQTQCSHHFLSGSRLLEIDRLSRRRAGERPRAEDVVSKIVPCMLMFPIAGELCVLSRGCNAAARTGALASRPLGETPPTSLEHANESLSQSESDIVIQVFLLLKTAVTCMKMAAADLLDAFIVVDRAVDAGLECVPEDVEHVMLAALGLVRRRWTSSAKEKSLHACAMHCFPLLELRRLEVLDLQICQKVGFWPKFLDDERLRIQYIHRLAALGERNCQVFNEYLNIYKEVAAACSASAGSSMRI